MDSVLRLPRLELAAPFSPRPAIPAPDEPGVSSWCDSGGSLVGIGHLHLAQPWLHIFGVASFHLDAGANKAVAVPLEAATQEIIWDEFDRTVSPVMLQLRGWELLHASAVKGPQGVTLFCAHSGTGKSTLASALGQAGYPVRSDDTVLLRVSRRGVVAASLPFRLRLKHRSPAHFGGEPGSSAEAPSSDQLDTKGRNREPFADRGAAAATVALERLDAICLLERLPSLPGGVPAAVAPAGSRAVPRLLEHSMFLSLQDRARKRRMLENYLEVVARLPIFDLRIRDGLRYLPQVIELIEEKVLGRCR